jgi:lipoate-protein ligase A
MEVSSPNENPVRLGGFIEKWRLLDTGVRTAAENMTLDDCILRARNEDIIPNTLHFLQFSPSSVLVGYHQSVEQEIRVEFCKDRGIDINRRITGGGALYFDEPQLGWEIIASKNNLKIPNDVEELYEKLCEGAIIGLRKLGVMAAFRPKNDIEVDGRKISGTGGALEGDAFLFQGTLLTDFDVDTMLRALRIPIEKLKDKEIESVKERVTCLAWELGHVPDLKKIKNSFKKGFEEVFGVEFEKGAFTEHENELFAERLPYFRSKEWIFGLRKPLKEKQELRAVHKTPGGLIRVSLVTNLRLNRIYTVLITGDFFTYPKRTIFDLEGRLKDTSAERSNIENLIKDFFAEKKPQIPGVCPDDFVKVMFKALEKMDYHEFGIQLHEANRVFTVNSSILEMPKCSVLLLPYCAKLPECEYRHRKDCIKCDDCNVGECYEFAEDRGIEVVTILDFEDLLKTLNKCKNNGVEAFIGSCCEAFYIKHLEDFERIGLPGVLVDIDDQTCYELGKEKEALVGEFENKTELRTDLIEKVMRKVCF